MKYNITDAVILCGGKGSRLKSLTKNIPKPMVEINNKPYLLYLIYKLKKYNFKRIFLLTGYKSLVIENYFKNINIQDIEIIIKK